MSDREQETILSVDGMSCASCMRHVERALAGLDGVGPVEVRLEAGEVRVAHDPARAPVDRLIAALGEAGYESRPHPGAGA